MPWRWRRPVEIREFEDLARREYSYWKELMGWEVGTVITRVAEDPPEYPGMLVLEFGDGWSWDVADMGRTFEELVKNYLRTVREWSGKEFGSPEELDMWLSSVGR